MDQGMEEGLIRRADRPGIIYLIIAGNGRSTFPFILAR